MGGGGLFPPQGSNREISNGDQKMVRARPDRPSVLDYEKVISLMTVVVIYYTNILGTSKGDQFW